MEEGGMAENGQTVTAVLILGSGPDATRARSWPRGPFTHVVAINNAWQVRDWDYLIHPEDFPSERAPSGIDPARQAVITADIYVPVQNAFGGFVYAGGTMAFTAGYWALGELKPDIIAFLGCDMVYAGNKTHFYGKGEADPLREDVTLQSLEAKSARLMALAAARGCLCLNLSEQPQSRLVFPRSTVAELAALTPRGHAQRLDALTARFDLDAMGRAERREAELGYFVPSGRYWQEADRFDAAALSALDDVWLKATGLKANQSEWAQAR
jgi:hypothetical protein